jgi:hypothetical protein
MMGAYPAFKKEPGMPNGIFPVPPLDSQPSRTGRTRPGLALRMRTWWRRDRLDDELAHGVHPATSAELTLRAEQLRSPEMRSQLAGGLVEALESAGTFEPLTVNVQPQPDDLRDCADEVLDLVLRLRDEQPVDVRGTAMTARLLTDGGSPLFRGGRNLCDAVRSARLALEPTVRAAEHLPTPA